MNANATEARSVIMERELPFAREKVWRALTQPHLIAEWLMQNDFKAVIDHRFNLSANWGQVDCQVRQIEPMKCLAYSWDAQGLESLVTWTLEETEKGTHLRMEQVGFKPDQERAYQGARFGWPRFLDHLAEVVGRLN